MGEMTNMESAGVGRKRAGGRLGLGFVVIKCC
jgi:hypothetical protein